MTLDDIRKAISNIEEIKLDDSEAHRAEASLREALIKAIAASEVDDPAAAAKLALTTKSIKFERWFA